MSCIFICDTALIAFILATIVGLHLRIIFEYPTEVKFQYMCDSHMKLSTLKVLKFPLNHLGF